MELEGRWFIMDTFPRAIIHPSIPNSGIHGRLLSFRHQKYRPALRGSRSHAERVPPRLPRITGSILDISEHK